MPEQHTNSLTVPASMLMAIIVIWPISLHWTANYDAIVVGSTVALWVTVGWLAYVIAGRLDDRYHREAREHSRQWFLRADVRARREGED